MKPPNLHDLAAKQACRSRHGKNGNKMFGKKASLTRRKVCTLTLRIIDYFFLLKVIKVIKETFSKTFRLICPVTERGGIH